MNGMRITEPGKAVPLIPDWTQEDYTESGEPYQWLYEQRDKNKFLFMQMFNKAIKAANRAGVTTQMFKQMWKAYVESMEPKVTILGANTTAFPGQETVLTKKDALECGFYRCDENGVSYIDRMGMEVQVISHPLMPVKLISNIDSGEVKVQLAFRRGEGGAWKTMIVGKDTVASAQRIINLAKNGVAVTSENAKEVVKFLDEMESKNLNDLPVQNSTGHLGWLPDGQFAPYAEGIEYDGESPEHNRMYAAFAPSGSYEAWLKVAKDARSGVSVPARIALAGAFAAPLVSMCNALPFIIHFYGTSGMGKSVGLMLSASVWAEPTVGGAYIKTFGGTKVAQELTAAFLCNVPMYLDELQIISDRKSFDDMIYMLCEGASKGRGSKDGGLQLQRRWSNCILTTGEMPIVQSNSGGGAAVRTIEVGYGGIPFFPDPREVSGILKENYGYAGRLFIEKMRKPEMMKRMKDLQKDFQKALSGDIHGKQVLSASILLAADKMADEIIFHDGLALTIEDIKPYLVTNQQADINYRCYQWLMGFIASNPRRFDMADNNGELWGIREGEYVFFIRTAFEKALNDAGYHPTTFLTWAKLNGKIKFENYGTGNKNNRLTVRKKINGHYTSCIAVLQDDTPDGFIEADDEDLPF